MVHDARGQAASEQREASNLTIALTIGYVRGCAGDDGVARLLALAGEKRPMAELLDDARWSTQNEKIRLFEAAAIVLDDPEVARRVGETVLRQQTGTAVRLMLRALGSPAALCRSVAKAGAKFATNYRTEAISVGRDEAVLSTRRIDGLPANRMDCDYTIGLLSQISAIFGLPPASVFHEECQVRGAPKCIYRLHWRSRYRLPWRARRARTEYLTEQLRLLTQRHEALQSTVVDLVSPADVDTVLARITQRAADAVRAQKFLLAIMGEDEQLVVHHDGMDRDDALRLASEILAPQPDDKGGSRLIVDVASSRRSYGRLAAFFGFEHTFFPEEKQLLATYALQAAVALDAATALEEARRRGETAATLLDLSRSLTQAITTDDVARRLAEAVPGVVGGGVAAVLLWERDRQQLTVRGRSGDREIVGPAGETTTITHEDTPAMARLLRSRESQHHHRDTTTDAFLRSLMETNGLEELLVVPIVSDGELLGAISTSRQVGSPMFAERRTLPDRLAGLADQAAVAFEKVRLLEHEREAVRRLRRDEQRIKHLAYHDALTGLPNGRLFADALQAGLAVAEADGSLVAVLFCDLDRFKNVNDSLGHAQGDEMLRLAAARLTGCIREGETLARLGGDEFTILLNSVSGPEEPAAVADRILDAFRDPFVLGAQEVFLSASVGFALFPEDGIDADTLLKNADTAMYGAKAGGRNTKERYAAVMNAGALHLLELEADLHSAVERGELIVHYQPQVDPRTMRIVATEALVRWLHPRRGLINPQDFIPLAEESGLIGAIDEWVLRHACVQAKAWEQAGFAPLTMAVNLSAHQFRRGGLVAVVGAVLAETGIDPDLLELELTETAAMQDPERVAQMLVELRQLGVRLAIDDYGTGYSILGHLKRLPVGRLKIDRAFVTGLPQDQHDGAIVASTIRMAHEVGMEVTAEGVENEAQASFLIERGCDLLQGFLYSQPVPAEAFGEMLRVQEGSISSAAVRS